MPDVISLIVPTRQRPERLRRLLASLADTTAQPEALEVILVIDADDSDGLAVADERLCLQRVVVAPGQTMGSLNMAGYEASRGRYLMLLNDDVTARTPAWDDAVRFCFAAYPDEIALVHVNDLVFGKHLCTFPIVSRRYCELGGGICPRGYQRYRIDDHIEDHFNLLGVLGQRRIIFTPEVIFEHHNYVEKTPGLRQYFSDPDLLARDAPLFDQLLTERKEAALRLRAAIAGEREVRAKWRRQLDGVHDSFALRRLDRQRVLAQRRIVDPWDLAPSLWVRASRCVRERGWRGVAAALSRRLRLTSTPA